MDPDPAADDGQRRRSPSPGTPAPDPDDGGSGWGSDKPPTRAEEGRVVGKDAMEPSPSPPDSAISDEGRHQVALSSPPGTPSPGPEDAGGSDDLTRAVSLLSLAEAGLTLTAPGVVDPSPPASTVSSHGHQDDDDDLAGVNKRTHARFLVTHAEAGLIIGTGGSAVAAVEAGSGARVRLSRHDQPLPGTDRRVVLVYGPLSQVMDAMELLLQRLLLFQVQGGQVSDSEATLVLVVPQPCCGMLIGKGGSVIKSFTEASETAIQISPQNISYGFNDRLVTITGPLDNLLRAVFLIIFELLEDVRYLFPYAAATPNIPMRSPVNKDAQESVTIAVADEHMGAVIGRGRRIINEISKPNIPMRSPVNKDAQEESVTIAVADEHMGAVIGRGGRIINEISKGGEDQRHIRGDPRSRGDDHAPRLGGQRQLDGAEGGGQKRQGSAYQAGRGGGCSHADASAESE